MKLKYDFYVSDFPGVKIAIAVGDDLGKYDGIVKMNSIAAEIFEMLKTDISRQEIIDNLSTTKCNETLEEIELVTDDFINTLKESGLLE